MAIKMPGPEQPEGHWNEAEYRMLQRLWQDPAQGRQTPVVQPVAYVEDLQVLVTRWHSAPTLRELLLEGDTRAPQAVIGMTDWITAFHRGTLGASGVFPHDWYHNWLRNLGRAARSASDGMQQRIAAYGPAFTRLLAQIKGTTYPTVRIHKNAATSNFLYENGTTTALDLAEVCQGDALTDYVALMMNVLFDCAYAPQQDPAWRDRMVRAIARKARLHSDPHRRDRARLLITQYILSNVCLRYTNTMHLQHPRFATTIEMMLAFADMALDPDSFQRWLETAQDRGELPRCDDQL